MAGLTKAGGPGEVSVGLVPLPIADATGGLPNTIDANTIDANTIDDDMTGFFLSTLWSDGLMAACHRAFDTRDDGAQLTDHAGSGDGRTLRMVGSRREERGAVGVEAPRSPLGPSRTRRTRRWRNLLPRRQLPRC